VLQLTNDLNTLIKRFNSPVKLTVIPRPHVMLCLSCGLSSGKLSLIPGDLFLRVGDFSSCCLKLRTGSCEDSGLCLDGGFGVCLLLVEDTEVLIALRLLCDIELVSHFLLVVQIVADIL
jgi:hypothetical protein